MRVVAVLLFDNIDVPGRLRCLMFLGVFLCPVINFWAPKRGQPAHLKGGGHLYPSVDRFFARPIFSLFQGGRHQARWDIWNRSRVTPLSRLYVYIYFLQVLCVYFKFFVAHLTFKSSLVSSISMYFLQVLCIWFKLSEILVCSYCTNR